ncbi:MAG: hypothetical protein VX938_13610, partial [Myxococcota bacterium]|nr:hypothetical protein [Myxococcota bacterium]
MMPSLQPWGRRWMLLGITLAAGPLACTGGSSTVGQTSTVVGDTVGADGTSVYEPPDTSSTASGDTVAVDPPPDVGWQVVTDTVRSDPVEDTADPPEEDAVTPQDGTGDSQVTVDIGDTEAPPDTVEDTEGLTEDAGPISPCDGVVCEAPAAVCDGLALQVLSGGVCVVEDDAPSCVFDTSITDCHEAGSGVCLDGACVPCSADVQCSDMLDPGPFCPNDLVTHSGAWVCGGDGLCAFDGSMSQCTGVSWAVCENDAVQWYANQCVEGTGCADVAIAHDEATDCGAQGLICVDLQFPQCADPTDTCDVDADCVQLPTAACKDLDLLQTYDTGTCFTTTDGPGICVYLPTYISCASSDQICGPDA